MKKPNRMGQKTNIFGSSSAKNVHKPGAIPHEESPKAVMTPEGNQVAQAVSEDLRTLTEDEQAAAAIYYQILKGFSEKVSMHYFKRHGELEKSLSVIDSLSGEIYDLIQRKLPNATVPDLAVLFAGCTGSVIGVALRMDKSGKMKAFASADVENLGKVFGIGTYLTARAVIEQSNKKIIVTH